MINPIVISLVSQGLDLIAGAVKSKGAEWIEKQTGVSLQKELSERDLTTLKQYELDNEEKLLDFKIETQKAETTRYIASLGDVANARELQAKALNQTDLFSKRFSLYLAVLWSIAALVFIFAITFFPIPENNVRFADTILGVLLGTVIAQIMQFFYGSSESSRTKDSFIKEVARGTQ